MSPTKKILTTPGFGLALAFGMALASAAVAAQTLRPPCSSEPARFDEWSAGSTASYEELVGDAKTGHIPPGLDLRQLRLKYAESPSYDPEAGSAEISEMNQKLADKDYDAALQIASDVLAKQYVSTFGLGSGRKTCASSLGRALASRSSQRPCSCETDPRSLEAMQTAGLKCGPECSRSMGRPGLR